MHTYQLKDHWKWHKKNPLTPKNHLHSTEDHTLLWEALDPEVTSAIQLYIPAHNPGLVFWSVHMLYNNFYELDSFSNSSDSSTFCVNTR